MTKISKLSISALAAAILATAITLALPVTAAAEANNEQATANIIEQIDDYGVATYASTVAPPTLIYKEYNAAVKYTWVAGSGADALAMYYSYHPYAYPEIFETTVFEQVAYPTTGTKDCVPSFIIAASYNTETGTFSDKTEVEWKQDISDIESIMRHGRDCGYNVVGQLNHSFATGNVPTSYDKANYIWKHNTASQHVIKGTISYHGYISDIEVTVPYIGYQSTYVTLDGVKFYLRTGPNRCSIKAGSSNVSADDIGFGFGTK